MMWIFHLKFIIQMNTNEFGLNGFVILNTEIIKFYLVIGEFISFKPIQ